MYRKFREFMSLGLIALLLALPLLSGCGSSWSSMKKAVGMGNPDEEEEAAEATPPEAKEETVMIDGKPYIRSKNPYWLSYPEQPEYIYVEKGREFVGAQQMLLNSLAKTITKEQAKAQGKAVPPDKVQEMVRAEVDRIMREQGLAGFVSQAGGAKMSPYMGRAVAVIPDLDTPVSLEGLNRTLAVGLGDAMARQKDIRVSSQEDIREAMRKAGVAGKVNLAANIKALGDALGVQGIVLTGLVPPEKGSEGAMAVQVFDAFTGHKEQAVVSPAAGGLKPEAITKFAQDNSLRVAGDLLRIPWFGRVEFIKEGKVYLNLGQNSGLKVGDRLKVVTPGKEVVNPTTHAVLGYTADTVQGELKVTELLGKSGAVAMPVNGGPFKANDKVRAAQAAG
jgi:hypothetical protein